MKPLKRFMYFCVLVDEEELEKVGKYDRLLIAASFARQMVGGVFTFLVFFFATSTYLPFTPSLLIASVLAAIVFFVDQAVIGSEWSIARSLGSEGVFAGFKGSLLKLIALLPRVAFAVMIALFMSTLAEITLQSRAIDRVLNERTRESNSEAMGRLDALAETQKNDLDRAQTELDGLRKELEVASDQSLALQQESLQSSLSSATERLEAARSSLQAVETQIVVLQQDVGSGESEVARLDNELSQVIALREKEVSDPERCRNPGAESCRGARWNEYNTRAIALGDQLVVASSGLASDRRLLDAALETRRDLREQIENLEAVVGEATSGLSQLSTSGRSVEVITAAIGEAEKELASLRTSQVEQTQELEDQLRLAGYMTSAVYDPLDRRIGLALLHEHPEYGPAAREFSWQLKMAVILFELAPVLVTVFFSPFSFLSMHMRRKRDQAMSEDKKAELKTKSEVARAQADADAKAREITTDMELDKAANARRLEYEGALADAGHFEELEKLKERISQSKSVIVDLERRSHNVEDRGQGDHEFDEIRRSMDLERLKHELLYLKSKTDLLEIKAKVKATRNEGDYNDQDAV